jgi:hypothetical protein
VGKHPILRTATSPASYAKKRIRLLVQMEHDGHGVWIGQKYPPLPPFLMEARLREDVTSPVTCKETPMPDGYEDGRTVISCHTDCDDRIDLRRFPDGTIAVCRNDQTVSVWGPADLEAGLTAYCNLAGIGQRSLVQSDVIVVLRTQHVPSQSNN